MNEPMVCAVMLTSNRAAMARRAVECFRAQDYDPARRVLLVYDGGDPSWFDAWSDSENEVHHVITYSASIGKLRNDASALAVAYGADIIVHMDSDDISGPSRISEQVLQLQASGADAVGYDSALFWRIDLANPSETMYCACGAKWWRSAGRCHECHRGPDGEAWIYTNPAGAQALGASLCYWRKTWERQPFRDVSFGEDLHFQLGLEVEVVPSIPGLPEPIDRTTHEAIAPHGIVNEPRLICTVHGGNTSTQINPAKKEWARAAEWDEYCRKVVG